MKHESMKEEMKEGRMEHMKKKASGKLDGKKKFGGKMKMHAGKK